MTTDQTLRARKGGSLARDARQAARELHAAIAQPAMKLGVFYCSPDYDLDALADELHRLFGDAPLIGCTTAGELGPLGYCAGSLSGVSVAGDGFAAVTQRIDDLRATEIAKCEGVGASLTARLELGGRRVDSDHAFGFLLIDGLSMREEGVVSALYRGLGDVQLFGGSAGDGTRFARTRIYHDGAFHDDAAVFTLVHTDHPFVVFKTQHFVGSDTKMVVTEADPARRIVTEINGEPAGREYARLVGLEVDELTPLIFSRYPVVVKLGGSYYVRSIQKVNDDGSLTFFCAIDEGIVLTVARGIDLVDDLRTTFADIRAQIGVPELVLGCDCILRHIELDEKAIKGEAARIYIDNNVVGFSTYGEQYNAMHVNQTFTGVAIGARKVA